ncbi:MAG: NADH-quinone oxidoreductase subunit M, partial [Candidatus Macondimonas sp.]
RVAFGPVTNPEVGQLNDVTTREFLILGLLAVAVLALGVWPQPLLAVIEPSVQQLLLQILPGKL